MKNLSKSVKVLLMSAIMTLCLSMAAFANDSGTVSTATVTAMTSLANDMKATATSLIPIALGVVGLSMVVIFSLGTYNSDPHPLGLQASALKEKLTITGAFKKCNHL